MPREMRFRAEMKLRYTESELAETRKWYGKKPNPTGEFSWTWLAKWARKLYGKSPILPESLAGLVAQWARKWYDKSPSSKPNPTGEFSWTGGPMGQKLYDKSPSSKPNPTGEFSWTWLAKWARNGMVKSPSLRSKVNWAYLKSKFLRDMIETAK
ncbi:hypothetical protein SDJN03_17823, partial [Cucurbita argyrosperma subsp. sororia]